MKQNNQNILILCSILLANSFFLLAVENYSDISTLQESGRNQARAQYQRFGLPFEERRIIRTTPFESNHALPLPTTKEGFDNAFKRPDLSPEEKQTLSTLARLQGMSRFTTHDFANLFKSKQTMLNQSVQHILYADLTDADKDTRITELFKHATPKEIQKALTAYEKKRIKSTEQSAKRSLTYQETKNIFKKDVEQYQTYLKPNQLLIPIEETGTQNKASFQYEIIDLTPVLKTLNAINPNKIDRATINAMSRLLKSKQGLLIKLTDIQEALIDYVKNRQAPTPKPEQPQSPRSVTPESQEEEEEEEEEEELMALIAKSPFVRDEEPLSREIPGTNNGSLTITHTPTTQEFNLSLQILGFKPSTIPTEDEVLRRFRTMSLSVHPDRNPASAEAFKALANAKDILIEGIQNPDTIKTITHKSIPQITKQTTLAIQRQLQTDVDAIQQELSTQEATQRNAILQQELNEMSELINSMPETASENLISEYETLLSNLKKQQLLEQQQTAQHTTLTQEQQNEQNQLMSEFKKQKQDIELNAAVAKKIREAKDRKTIKDSEESQRTKLEQEQAKAALDLKTQALIAKNLIKDSSTIKPANRSAKLLTEEEIDEIVNRVKITEEQIKKLKELQNKFAQGKLSIEQKEQIQKQIQALEHEEQSQRAQLLHDAQESIDTIQKEIAQLKTTDEIQTKLKKEAQDLQNTLTQQEQTMRTMNTQDFEESFKNLEKMIEDIKYQKAIILMEKLERNVPIGEEMREFDLLAKQFSKERQIIENKAKATENTAIFEKQITQALDTQSTPENIRIKNIVKAINEYKNRENDITNYTPGTYDPYDSLTEYENKTTQNLKDYYANAQQAIQEQLNRLSEERPIDQKHLTDFTNQILNEIQEKLEAQQLKVRVEATLKLPLKVIKRI